MTKKIELNIEDISDDDVVKIQEMVVALVGAGAHTLKNGKATLHFNDGGVFMGVQLDYWAFKRKKLIDH